MGDGSESPKAVGEGKRRGCQTVLKTKVSPPAKLRGLLLKLPTLPGATWVPSAPWAMGSALLPGRERAVAKMMRAQDTCPRSGPMTRPGAGTRRRGAAGWPGAGRARGAGRAGSSPLKSWTWRAASRPARKRGFGQKRGRGSAQCVSC